MNLAQARRKREMAMQLQMTALATQGSAKAIREQVRAFEKDR